MKKDPKVPCKECAFRRDITPGALGGSPPETYIGQAYAPFAIPCHCHCDFDDPDWKKKAGPGETPQCAGVAVFRANIGAHGKLPAVLTPLEPDFKTVFGNPVEFLAHHKQISVDEAFEYLTTPGTSIPDLVMQQLNRQDNINFPLDKDK